jgi:hypothetical protein
MIWKCLLRFLTAIGLVLAVMVLTAAVIIFFPLLLTGLLSYLLAELWFHWRLRLGGRIFPWEKAVEQLCRQGGTLVVEVGPPPGLEDRLWLLHDHLAKIDPNTPWDSFALAERQVWGGNGTLTLPDELSTWCQDRLPYLAASVCLVTLPGGVTARQCLSRARLPTRTVAVVPSPQVTRAVRRSFRQKHLAR